MKNNDFLYSVYLLRCNDGSLYCGITINIERRISQHNSGKGAKYCRGKRLPVSLVASVGLFSIGKALMIESGIKKLPKASKISALSEFEN